MTRNREYALDFVRRHFPDYLAIWIESKQRYVICVTDPSNGLREVMGVCWFDENDGWPTFHTLTPGEAVQYHLEFDLDAMTVDI